MIDSLPSTGRYFCKQISSFWLDNRDVQGCKDEVRWRLGIQVWRPHVWNWGLSEANVLFWKKCSWYCCNFLPPVVIRRPRNCSPLPPSLRLWCYAIKIKKFSENKQIFKSERHEPLFHEHLQFSNAILGLLHRACIDWQQRLLAAFQVSSCSFCVTSDPVPRVFQRGPVFVLLIIKLFQQSTSYFFKVREVWE